MIHNTAKLSKNLLKRSTGRFNFGFLVKIFFSFVILAHLFLLYYLYFRVF